MIHINPRENAAVGRQGGGGHGVVGYGAVLGCAGDGVDGGDGCGDEGVLGG